MVRGRPPKIVDPCEGPRAAFAHVLRARRLHLGLTLAQVSTGAHCSLSTLGEYERAERVPRSAQLVEDLAETLDLPPEGLLELWNRNLAGAHAGPTVPCLEAATPAASRFAAVSSWSSTRQIFAITTLFVSWTTAVVVATVLATD